MKEDFGTVQYASLLFDFYGKLLGESRQEVMSLYHEDNLSLTEIAEELGTSRQAVHYTLKKAEADLEKYEEKLGLLRDYHSNQAKAEAAVAACRSVLESADLSTDERGKLESVIAAITELSE